MFINVQGKKIHFLKEGQGQPLLFLHGWGGSINSLTPLANLFSKKYQVINLDLPGFGLSDLPDPKWGVKEYSELILSFLKQTSLEKIILFGHSFGGSLAIYLAAKHPDFIDKLILSAPSYKRELKKSRNLLTNFPQLFRILLYRIFFPCSDLWRFPKLETNFRRIVQEDFSSYLPKINANTLILWGTADKETPVQDAYYLKEKIKNSQIKVYANEGHSLPLKKPELIFKVMEKFL